MTGFFDGVTGCHIGKQVRHKVVVRTFGESPICIAFDTSDASVAAGLVKLFSVETPGLSYEGLTYEEALRHVQKDLNKELPNPIPVCILPESVGVSLEVKDGWEVFSESHNPDYVKVRLTSDHGKTQTVEKDRVILPYPGIEHQIAKQKRRQDIIERSRNNGYRTHDFLKKNATEKINAVLKVTRK